MSFAISISFGLNYSVFFCKIDTKSRTNTESVIIFRNKFKHFVFTKVFPAGFVRMEGLNERAGA